MKTPELKAWGIWLTFLTILFVMTSCRSVKPVVVTEKVTETITETVHDTVFQTEKDSSLYQALLECREGKVVVKEVTNAQAGKYLKAPKVKVKDNRLECDCEAQAQKLVAQYKSKNRVSTQIKEVPVIVKEPLKLWQKALMWIGGIALVVAIIWLLKTIYNPAKFLSNGK